MKSKPPSSQRPSSADLTVTASTAASSAITASPVERETLARWTAARVGLGRAGCSLPTKAHLAFLHDHARARDAVWSAVDFDELDRRLRGLDVACVRVRSRAGDRDEYLKRPDLGRLLDDDSRAALSRCASSARAVVVVADGLSAQAIAINCAALIEALLPQLAAAGIEVGAIVMVEQGRVAIGDPIAVELGAELSIVLIGERPGLSASDSLGCYLTWSPRPGTPDSRRNCISNIRAGGLAPVEAACKIAWMSAQALRLRVSGLELKDASPRPSLPRGPGALR